LSDQAFSEGRNWTDEDVGRCGTDAPQSRGASVRKNPRKSRAFAARFEQFERRRLLSDTPFTISGFTQNRDFVGPDASVGADGIADVHLTLGSLNLNQQISSAQVVGSDLVFGFFERPRNQKPSLTPGSSVVSLSGQETKNQV